MSLENAHDARALPTLLNPLWRKLRRVYADGAYDSKARHQLISRKGATACIPPCKNAGLWEEGHPRAAVWVSSALIGRDGDISVQAVAGGENQSA
ncbi:transposase [Aeromonas sp.]|uniref:transposase n=1 Tax=Aeromonas sp. TaxID=647 RepID=UPI00258FC443|nr:transposase [Aeromonas sp.]MCX7127209.1 transposase [Aeromonas sp.]